MRGSQMMCRCPLRVADNGFGLGEVAEPNLNRINNFKIKNE